MIVDEKLGGKEKVGRILELEKLWELLCFRIFSFDRPLGPAVTLAAS